MNQDQARQVDAGEYISGRLKPASSVGGILCQVIRKQGKRIGFNVIDISRSRTSWTYMRKLLLLAAIDLPYDLTHWPRFSLIQDIDTPEGDYGRMR